MTFENAVEETPGLENAYRSGLQALRAMDRERLTAARPRQLCGSVDLDAALRASHPQANRWDYGIAAKAGAGETVYWVEVHPATDGEAASILAKLTWLETWLTASARHLDQIPREFVWVASGATSVTPRSPRMRQLALRGLTFEGRHFTIP